MVKYIFAFLAMISGLSASGESTIGQLKKSISFVYHTSTNAPPQAIGTGFWVGIPHPTLKGQLFPYFVTAKHVISHAGTIDISELALRVNTPSGNARFVRLSQLPTDRVLTHHDPGVDVAALPIVLPKDEFEIIYVPSALLASAEDLKKNGVEEGEDIFFGGMFTHFHGDTKNIPVFRFGKIATTEPARLSVLPEGPAEFFLAETQSYPGFSGSPVFVKVSMMKNGAFSVRERIFLWV
jgi:hypothetical protein